MFNSGARCRMRTRVLRLLLSLRLPPPALALPVFHEP
jgi:hypothetical protein